MICYLLSVVIEFVRDREHADLLRAQPCRELTLVFLDQPCECALIASHTRSVDDIRTDLVAVLIDVIQIKALGVEHIHLDSDHRIFLAVNILGLNIQLGTIECCLTLLLVVVDTEMIQHAAHQILYLIPLFCRSEIILCMIRIPQGQAVAHILLNAQRCQAVTHQIDTSAELLLRLIGTEDQMSLGDRELAHTGQTVHLTCLLVSEERRCLTVAAGHIAVAVLALLENKILERAGHRPEGVGVFTLRIVLLLIAEQEHAVLIVAPMI